jgi:L-amino acid N-acyltransferase YncA
MTAVIRDMDISDWEAVRTIYLDGIATGQATFETTAPAWERWHQSHLPAPRIVAIEEGRVVGWGALSPVSARAVYAGVAEVSVYVGSKSRGQGIGRALLENLIKRSESQGIWTLQASIFPENSASISLHESCGFRKVGTRERIAKLNQIWRNTMLLERRSTIAGND